jgi:hypothetical protein
MLAPRYTGRASWDRGRKEEMEQFVITIMMREYRIKIIVPAVTVLKIMMTRRLRTPGPLL